MYRKGRRVSLLDRAWGLALVSAIWLIAAGCASMPVAEQNEAFTRAREAYARAQADPNVTANAPVALYEAGEALRNAEKAETVAEMDHRSYVAERKSQIAIVLAETKKVEAEREQLIRQKDKMIIETREAELARARRDADARAQEAERARREAEARSREVERARGESEARLMEIERARKEAEAKALEAEQARKEAEAKALALQQARAESEARALEIGEARKAAEVRAQELEQARKDAEAKALEATLARQRADEALEQARQMEQELAELKAKQTERGIVLTLGDILFETGKAALMPGAMLSIDKVAEFLKKNTGRNIRIEGHTDSRGGAAFNLDLSQRRAESVRDVLVAKGIGPERILAKGYGEDFPVAGNTTEAGRQQNRRVEIVILREGETPEGGGR